MTEAACDVAVIGGGPAGCAAAAVLARQGMAVALLEATASGAARPGESLAAQARPWLAAIGIDDPDAQLPARANYANRSVWGDDALRTASFVFHAHGHGWHLDRAAFDALLLRHAVAAGARVRRGARATRLQALADGRWRLAWRDAQGDHVLVVGAVLDAGGRRSMLWRGLDAERRPLDRLVAVARVLRMPRQRTGSTLVEACEDGWWYSAPLPGARRIAMLMTDADLCHRGRYREPGAWEAALARCAALRDAVAGGTPVHTPQVHAAGSHRLRRREFRGRWLACGDAAMAVDPLSSSGLERALRTAVVAARALAGWLDGDDAVARRYERALDREFDLYWQQRCDHYRQETRWPHAEFWRRRQSPNCAGPVAARDPDRRGPDAAADDTPVAEVLHLAARAASHVASAVQRP